MNNNPLSIVMFHCLLFVYFVMGMIVIGTKSCLGSGQREREREKEREGGREGERERRPDHTDKQNNRRTDRLYNQSDFFFILNHQVHFQPNLKVLIKNHANLSFSTSI